MKNRIRELREALGLSQTQLAEKIGSSQVIMSRIENDKQPMTDQFMLKAATALGVHPSDLMTHPDWNRFPLAHFNEPLLRQIMAAVLRFAHKHPQLSDDIAAAVATSLYKRFTVETANKPLQPHTLASATELLMAHEMGRRAA
jgi:transcriptional regulator with XRE-family HTH domain